MKSLARSGVSKAALFGILFFAVGCGSKDDKTPPNYVVREVQTGTMTENSQGAAERPAEGKKEQAAAGNSSIVREEVGETAGKENGIKPAQNPSEDGEGEPSGMNPAQKPSEDGEGGSSGINSAKSPSEDSGKGLLGVDPAQNPSEDGREELSEADFAGNISGDAGEAPLETDLDQILLDEERTQLSGITSNQALPEVGGTSVDMAEKELTDGRSVEEIRLLEAGTVVETSTFSTEKLSACFYFEEVPDAVFLRMQGNSYSEDCTVALSQLRYVRVLHYGFDGEVHIGELVVNQAIAEDICDIFRELFDAQYPIEKMVLIDTYGGDDDASMADNNTSSFNFRVVEGTTSLSKHAYGLAVDLNPLYNPYIPVRDGVLVVRPENAKEYVDREAECEYYIRHGDLCYEAFVSRGFTWGGDWVAGKDYQHFSKAVE